ncbi:MAG: hypothetical protein ACREQ5_23810, partial [Candidatus Dormibacteria bacterium]
SNPAGFEEADVGGATVSISHVSRVAGIDHATGASFLSASTGWLVADGSDQQGGPSVILATSDGGHTWRRQYQTSG